MYGMLSYDLDAKSIRHAVKKCIEGTSERVCLGSCVYVHREGDYVYITINLKGHGDEEEEV